MIAGGGAVSARVIQVIETEIRRGDGTHADPFRIVTQYWTLDGELLADVDELELDRRGAGLPVGQTSREIGPR